MDDEIGCISNLKYFLTKYCPDIKVIGESTSLEFAYDLYQKEKIDIAFLDVEMGTANIFSFIEKIDCNKTGIVFVTAFEKYAIKAVKVQALDYILKPLMRSDILECYKKILKWQEQFNLLNEVEQTNKQVCLKQGERTFIVKLQNIHYLKACGSYTQIGFTYGQKHLSITVCKPIGDVAKEYDDPAFYRVHKSYLINCKRISEIEGRDISQIKMESGICIPLAKRRVHEFMSFLKSVR